MFSKFEALECEKRRHIINAAMTEFVRGGFEKASMNKVVEQAGISKGSLFYYFGSKKKLYLYLFEYCEKQTVENAKRHMNPDESDFLKRMEHVVLCNAGLLKQYPLVYAFVNGCKAEKSEKVKTEIEELKVKHSDDLFSRVYKNIDTSLFKEGLDIQMAQYVVKTTMFQMVHDAMRHEEFDLQVLAEKIEKCRQFFETTLYK